MTMLSARNVYQGGLPLLPRRNRKQRGSSWLAALGRMAVPLFKKAAPIAKAAARSAIKFAKPIAKNAAKQLLPTAVDAATRLIQGEPPPTREELAATARNIGSSIVQDTGTRLGQVVQQQAPEGLGDIGAHLIQVGTKRLSKAVTGKNGTRKRAASSTGKTSPAKKKKKVTKRKKRGRGGGGGGWRR